MRQGTLGCIAVMSSHSGTIGRKRGEYYFGSGNEQMRRQRSAEWHHRHGYSSSEDEYQNTQQAAGFDTQLLATLLIQSQQLASEYRFCKNFVLGMLHTFTDNVRKT